MQQYYRFLHSDKNVRKLSSSGGAFTLISDIVLHQGGIVYGCIMDENLRPRHIRSEDVHGRDKMRGSKYIQSDMRTVYWQISQDLCNGKTVLFSGTPCQTFAVSRFLNIKNIDTNNLILLEVICHGVGSNRFFGDYLEHLENKYRGQATTVRFRAKHHKGQKQDMEVLFDNGRRYNASSTKYDWFYSAYQRNLILRPSCYECFFAQEKRYADLTIADHWGYLDDESYSLIICNSFNGEKVLNQICSEKVEPIARSEANYLCKAVIKPAERETFWNLYNKRNYLEVQKWLGNNTWKGKSKNLLAKLAYDMHIAGMLKKLYKRFDKKRTLGCQNETG